MEQWGDAMVNYKFGVCVTELKSGCKRGVQEELEWVCILFFFF